MLCSTNNPAVKRYMARFVVAMLAYALFLVLSVLVFVHYRPTGVIAWTLAVLPAVGIIWQMVIFGLYLGEEKDEFMRNLQIQAMLWGIGSTLTVTTVWGFLEGFVHIHHMDPILVYPIFCILSGLSAGLIWTLRYK